MNSNFGYLKDLLKQMYKGQPLSITKIDMIGSRKSKKTVNALLLILESCLIGRKVKSFIIRNMSDQLQDTWKELKTWLFAKFMGIPWQISETRKTLTYMGSEVECRSLHKINNKDVKLTGLPSCNNYDYVIRYTDERYEVSQNDAQDLTDAIRGSKHLLEINSCNPWSIFNEYIKSIIDYCPQNENLIMRMNEQFYINKKDKRIVHFQNWKLNEHINQSDADSLLELERLDPMSARVRSIGLVGMEAGGIYTHLLPKVSRILTHSTKFIGGLDYGFKKDATATVLLGTDKNYQFINVIDCLKWTNDKQFLDHKQIAEMIIKFYIKHAQSNYLIEEYGLTIYCDYSNYSFIEILNDTAIKYRCSKWLFFKECIKLRLEFRIGKTLALMASERINLSMNAQELYKEWTLAVWDMKSTRQIPLDINNHLCDAFDYAIEPWLQRIQSNINPFY